MIGRGDLAAGPIRSPGGHASTYEETERRLRPALELVPITRVYDATPLDWLGLPVWAAVTPLALDLTVHAGKGTTPAAARISATMEAIERVCAEAVPPATERRIGSYRQLRSSGALDPEQFDLPFESAYRPDRSLSWVRGYDLLRACDVWVPLDVVISPPREGICIGVETNGLAAGNTVTEAIVHALYELIERDADAHDHFTRRYADDHRVPELRVVDVGSLPPEPAGWVQTLRGHGMSVTIRDLTHDLDVPVLRASVIDPGFPGAEGRAVRFAGVGCDLDPAWAATRCVCEGVQSHTVMVLGARDAVEELGPPAPIGTVSLLRQLLSPTSVGPLASPRGPLPGDLLGRLDILLARLDAAGLRHCVVADLTRPELGIPVVRVLVPGLSGPYGDTARRPAERLLRALL